MDADDSTTREGKISGRARRAPVAGTESVKSATDTSGASRLDDEEDDDPLLLDDELLVAVIMEVPVAGGPATRCKRCSSCQMRRCTSTDSICASVRTD